MTEELNSTPVDASTRALHESAGKMLLKARKKEKKAKVGDYEVGKNKPPKEHQFKPGQSGNPKGAEQGNLSLINLMKKRLSEVDPQTKRTYAEQFIDNILQDAADLDGPSRKLVLNYIEGMPKQPVEYDINKEGLVELTEFFRSIAQKPDKIETNNENGGSESTGNSPETLP